jgi:hypothetical protein
MRLLTYIGYMIMGIFTVVIGNIAYSVFSVKLMEYQARKENSETLVEMD